MRILLVDHDRVAARQLKIGLEQQGYSVDLADSSVTGDETAVVDHHDAILLVGRLPALDSIRLCRELREQKVAAPIMILADSDSTTAMVAGLDAGADDYMEQPVEMDELLARLRSLLRRSRANEGSVLRSGNLVLNLDEHRVSLAGTQVKLSAKEFALLEFLMRNPRRLLTRTMISESVWNMNYRSDSNVIDVYVSSLRRKVDRGPRKRIETVIGSGYRFLDLDDEPLVPAPRDA